MEIVLRDYQREVVNLVIDAYKANNTDSVYVVLPCGSGKTICFSSIIHTLLKDHHVNAAMIIAHRDELLQQAADKYRFIDPDARIGKIGGGIQEYGMPITVASIATISRPNHLQKLIDLYGTGKGLIIVTDECFPAGTLIDGKPIEQIKAGDIVTAFDENTQTFAPKKVVRTFNRPVSSQLVKITSGQHTIVCTPNHPFYASSGWKNAGELIEGEEVLYANTYQNTIHSNLYCVSKDIPHYDKISERQIQKQGENILLGGMQEEVRIGKCFENNGSYQQEICKRKNEEQQSYEERGNTHQSTNNIKGHRAQTSSTGRQWEGSNTTTDSISNRIEVANGIYSKNKGETQQQSQSLPNMLQVRYSQSRIDDCDRGGWSIPSNASQESTGPEENRFSYWARVDSIEVHEQGSDGTFGGLCTDGYVYNFEVEDFHTYTANGFVVHNCHHSESAGYKRVIETFPDAFILGVTATPDRLDKKIIFDGKPPLFQLSIIEMIQRRYLCNMRAIAIRTQTNLGDIKTKGGDYDEHELDLAVNTEARNKRIVESYLEHANGRKAICFAVTIHHAENLCKAFNDAGVPAACITGNTPMETRHDLYQKIASGLIKILVSVMVLAEGFDETSVDCVIMGRPTQSRSLFTQCLDDKTEILTIKGWKHRGEISKGDLVAGFNKDTEEIKWVPAINTFERPLAQDEKMYELDSPSLNFRVTGGHRMLYRTTIKENGKRTKSKWGFIEAQDLYNRPNEYDVPIAGTQIAPGVPLTDDELRFIGWFMTDGTISKTTNAISISQSAHQPYHEDIKKCLVGCGFKYGIYESASKSQFHRNSNDIRYSISKGMPRGTDKHLTGWARLEPYIDKDLSPLLENVTTEQLEVLLETANMADGSKQHKEYYSHGTTWTKRSYTIVKGNKTFVERLQSLCVRHGFKCNVAVVSREAGSCYHLHIKKTSTRTIGGKHATDRPHLEISESFPGEIVWCVENELGTLITRRNGKVTIMGNCLGRMLRLHPGKQDAILLDITDNCLIHRLSPMNLGKAIGVWMKDEDETLIEALERKEEEEREAKQAQIRRLKERRPKDIHIDLLQVLEWKQLDNGSWTMEVGADRHIIGIAPCTGMPDLFYVAARLAPSFQFQKWSGPLTLEECQMLAEKKARTLHEGSKALVDRNANWRNDPASEGQLKKMRWHKIDIPEHCTKGQAGELIDAHLASIQKKKAEKAARKMEKYAKKLEQDKGHLHLYTEGEEVSGHLNVSHGFSLMR